MARVVCAICERRTDEPVYPLSSLLLQLGITGSFAHVSCIKRNQAAKATKERRTGLLN